MNRYESYKKVNLPWLNEIPSHWEVKRISRALLLRKEKNLPIKTREILSLSAKYGVSLYSEKKEKGGNKPKEDLTSYNLCYPDDILVNCMNIVSGSVGISNYFGAVSPIYYPLTNINKNDNYTKYMEYIFRNYNFQRSLVGLGKGIQMSETEEGNLFTIRMRISWDILKIQNIPLPPISEQKQIANYLDWKINEIDKLILVEKEKIKQLEKEKRILIANKYKSLDKKIRLKMLVSEPLLYGLNEVGKTNGKIRFVRITDIDKMGNLRCENNLYIENCNEKFLLNFGDILFARSGATVGKSYLHLEKGNLMAFAGYLIRARLNQNLVLPEFIYYYTQSESYKIWKDSMFIKSTIQNISAEKYNNLEIPFGNINEQNIIVNEIKNLVTLIDNNNSFINQKINQLQLLKQSLIAEVVTGKIDVREVVIPKYEKSTIIEEDEIEEMEI